MSKAHQDGVTVAFLVLSCFRVLAETCGFISTILLPINQIAKQLPNQPVGQLISQLKCVCMYGHAYSTGKVKSCWHRKSAGQSGAGQCRAGQGGAEQGRARQGKAGQGRAHSMAHSMAGHDMAQHSTAWHGTARHGTAQHSTAQHSTASEHPDKSLASMSHLVLLISQELL